MTGHGILCACTVHDDNDDLDDDYVGKAIARAAEPDIDQPTDCD